VLHNLLQWPGRVRHPEKQIQITGKKARRTRELHKGGHEETPRKGGRIRGEESLSKKYKDWKVFL